jgi:hypothetical protein
MNRSGPCRNAMGWKESDVIELRENRSKYPLPEKERNCGQVGGGGRGNRDKPEFRIN